MTDPTDLTQSDPEAPTDQRSVSVYFVRAGIGPVKIGVAVDVKKRLDWMQSGNHHDLVLLATVVIGTREAALSTERELHNAFADIRVRGEWFRADRDLLDLASLAAELGAAVLSRRGLTCPACGCWWGRRRLREDHYGMGRWLGEVCGDASAGVNELRPCPGRVEHREDGDEEIEKLRNVSLLESAVIRRHRWRGELGALDPQEVTSAAIALYDRGLRPLNPEE